jgi:hypothetical protein
MKAGDMVLIVGRTGSGKSVEAIERVKEFRARNPSTGVVIINPKPVKTEWDDLIEAFPSNPKKESIPVWKAGALINWKVRPWQDAELNDFLWSIYVAGKPALIVFDEGQDIKSNKFASAAALWRQGREMKISIITCTQRPVDMSRYAISQAKEISVYNIIGEDDLKALDSYMEIPLMHYISPSKTRNGVLVEGKRLGDFQHLIYNVRTGKAKIAAPVERTPNTMLKVAKKSLPIKHIVTGAAALILLKVFI